MASGQRAEVPPTACNAATETSEIQRDIVLLPHKIMPLNISNALFFDKFQHLNKNLDFISRFIAL